MVKSNRGGARPGAGAKLHGKEAKVNLCVTVDQAVFDHANNKENRGGKNRSSFVNDALKKIWGLQGEDYETDK